MNQLLIFFSLAVAGFAGTGKAQKLEDVCRLPVDHGSCRAGLRRYYYDTKEEKCKFFLYGGCGGNQNKFLQMEECENACGMKKKVCPKICPFIYSPVCGSDGKTYPSPCNLKVKACVSGQEIQIEHEGECKDKTMKKKDCPKICPLIYRPVCGSDGKTYPSPCNLKAKACVSGQEIQIEHEGECENKKKTCVKPCPRIYRPVCGSDGNTYTNICLMEVEACVQSEDISVAHQGSCEDEKN